jgi:hypothetical protein
MNRISSQTTFLYHIVWPVFSLIYLPLVIWVLFKYLAIPAAIMIGFVYISAIAWTNPIFLKLRNVYMTPGALISDKSGKQVTIRKQGIGGIFQNPSGITPRIVTIELKSKTVFRRFIKFSPIDGYWIFNVIPSKRIKETA